MWAIILLSIIFLLALFYPTEYIEKQPEDEQLEEILIDEEEELF
ncbi:MAG: hypothetical protein ACTSU7_01640 [Candidatus Heimdallarchaeaceae archaeon]